MAYGYSNLSDLIEKISVAYKSEDIYNMAVVLKFKDITNGGSYKYYNFDLVGIFDKNRCLDDFIPSATLTPGVSFSEKRGEYLRSNFKDDFFYIYNIVPVVFSKQSNVVYNFKCSPINREDEDYLSGKLGEKYRLIRSGGLEVKQGYFNFK